MNDSDVKAIIKAPASAIKGIFQEFYHYEASSGILLLVCTVLALVWANSPWAAGYFHLWETHLTIGIGPLMLDEPLHIWINDGLMALFFLVVGLEIKREMLAGDLSSPGDAVLPVAAALGGMVVPAVVYTLLNANGAGAGGWGVPVATDIAFTLGIIALMRTRVPSTLKMFFAALAIADDIGAVLIIALFYSQDLALMSLVAAAALLLALFMLNWLDVRHPLPYMLLGVVLWLALLHSGLHATIAGVLVALTIPALTEVDADEYVSEGRALLNAYEKADLLSDEGLTLKQQQAVAAALDRASEQAESPLQRLEHALHPWVSYGVVPLFVLANAGVGLQGASLAAVAQPVTLGIVLGLVIGKPLGISLFSWLAVKLGIAHLPKGVSWGQMIAVSLLAGIGFTMSLFIAGLAFEGSALLEQAKIGILAASLLAGLVGGGLLFITSPAPQRSTG
jgi:NhaA family Na+:H+ antiporter